jgi:hypothetical protein
MTRKMHIAKSGKDSGKWVTCPAQTKCRIGGVHTTSASLKDAKSFAGKKRIGEITYKEYVGYLKTKIAKYHENEKQENLPTPEEFKILIHEENKEVTIRVKKMLAERDAQERRVAEIIAQQDAKFETVKEFSFSVEKENGERVFRFTDKNNNVISLNDEQAQTLQKELKDAEDEYDDKIERAIFDDYPSGDDDYDPGYDDDDGYDDYPEVNYISSLNKSITIEEVNRLSAQITTETEGFDAYKSYKEAEAQGQIFGESLQENLDNSKK